MDLYFLIRAGFALSSCALIVRRALMNKSLDVSGAVAAFVVGFVLTITNLCFFASLMVFFLSSSKLTKFRSEIKRELEEDFKEGKSEICKLGKLHCTVEHRMCTFHFGYKQILFLYLIKCSVDNYDIN